MIFKTFENDIDKISAKWGIFGKSFYDFAEASRNRKIAIDDLFTIEGVSLKDAKKQAGSFWSYLYPKKEDIESLKIDVDKIIPKIDEKFNFDFWINKLNDVDKEVQAGTLSWQDYSDSLNDNQKWIAKWGQETQGSIRTQNDLVIANQKARQSAIEHNKIIEQSTLAFKAKTLAVKALSVAMNVGLSLAIGYAISWITKLANAEQESIEKTKESTRLYKEQIKTLEQYKEEYLEIIDSEKTYVEKTKEINEWKKALIETYGFEKDALEKVNTERKTGIELIDNEIEKSRNLWLGNNAEQSKKAISKIETDLFSSFTIQNASVENKSLEENIRQEILDIFDSAVQEWDSGNAFFNYDEQISLNFNTDTVYETKEKIEEALSVLGKIGYDNLSYQEKELSKQLNAHKEKIDKIIEDYGDTYSTYNEYTAQNLFSQFISQAGNQIGLVTEETFEVWKTNLLNMAGESEPLRNALQKIIDETFPQFVSGSKNLESSSNSTTDSIYKFKQVTEELQTALDNTFSNQSTLQSAFDKIQEGTSLSADEVRKLIILCKDSYPEIATAFTETADGYTISANDIISANEAITKSTKEELQNQINEYQKIVDEYNDKKSYVPVDIPYSEYKEYISNLATESDKAQLAINVLRLVIEMFGLTTNKTVDKIKDLDDKYKELSDTTSKLTSKGKTLSSAFAEQNENGKLSTDTVLSLIENGYAAALMYDTETGAIRLNAQAYTELAKAEIEEQIADLKVQKSLAENTIIQTRRNIVSNLGWSYLGAEQAALELEKAQRLLNDATADVSGLDAQIKALEDYQGKIGDIVNGTYGGSGGSSTDPIKEAFEKEKALRQHWLAMGKDDKGNTYNKDMYYEWLDGEEGYKKYFSDLTKYQEENRQYEEEVYKWRLEQDNKLFEQKLENNEKLIKEIKNGEYDDPIQKYDELAKATENSLKLVQARINELVASGSGAVQDEIDNLKKQAEELQDDLAEIEKDKLKTRVDNEKTFWEQQKEAVETYYDNELKKLEEIEDEQERINKKEELRLNLIKAQQELLNAKKNRNQLLFADGGFYYDYDQEAVQNAQENVTKAQQDITDFNNDETKRLLEEQRDNEIAYYNTIIEMLEAYINKTSPIESSDSEIFNTAMNSKYAQAVLAKKNNITKPMTPVTLESFLQDNGFKYNKEVVSAGYNLYEKVIGNSLSIPNEIAKSFSGTTYNNSTVNNNETFIIQNMPIYTKEGTTAEQVQSMIDQFGKGVLNAMRANKTKIQ